MSISSYTPLFLASCFGTQSTSALVNKPKAVTNNSPGDTKLEGILTYFWSSMYC